LTIEELLEPYKAYIKHSDIIQALRAHKTTPHLHLKRLHGSSPAVVLSQIFTLNPGKYLIILRDKEEAAYFYNDLNKLADTHQVFFLPSSYKHSIAGKKPLDYDSANLIMRTEVLAHFQSDQHGMYVSYPEAIQEKVFSYKDLQKNTITFKEGESVDMEFVEEILETFDFVKVDFVYEPGQYAVRGSLLDIFSFAHDDPYRVDFFGDEVESIRSFDPVNQLSKATFHEVSIVPNLQEASDSNDKVSLLSWLPQHVILGFHDYAAFLADIKFNMQKDPETLKQFLASADEVESRVQTLSSIEFSPNPSLPVTYSHTFSTKPQPDYNKNFQLLTKSLLEFQDTGYQLNILSENPKQFERLEAIFSSETNNKLHFNAINSVLHEGFIDEALKICLYTDHQIFKRYHKFSLKSQKQRESKQALTIKELNSLEVGDYVVHVDHGVGRFAGLQRIDINGKQQEVIRLDYKEKDVLFVNIHSLHKISKYRSKDGIPPKIYRLGSGAWQRLKQKTKKKVKDIAKELIQLYAKRRYQKGFAYSPDSYLQHELESSFFYEDTPDQLKATKDVKQDMEAETPMDRLVCGDVGFGKTEVAIRAAFKAVTDNKQVVVLVPTTILAYQHYHTFSRRLKDLPVNVDYLSRLKPQAKQRQTIRNIQTGRVDIVIGTHRLVSKDMKFYNLGLLIIDEEQKFGVTVKEKLKSLKVNVDTLTLTATPIPRTLQFSLMGARELSIINTPPPNRYPIITEVHQFNQEIIKEAIEYETERNGQVYFIHNRVQNIAEVEQLVHRVAPDARTAIAHGQMEGPKLESVMLHFINHEYDVLIATSIIESGLDIPNVNTIIINNAHHFGLSDLHQMRGRVGRTNKKAFAYMLAPPLEGLTQDARRRLTAIEEFSELGSGFTIAMRDLDIRGAGDLLGAEQSGFINDIGFETYQQILDESITELKEGEFSELFANQNTEKPSQDIRYVADCQIDTDLELMFPEDYIENISERINLYKELDSIGSEEEMKQFSEKIRDRFGAPPEKAKELMNVVPLRQYAMKLGMEKIVLKSDKMLCYFVANPESAFYKSSTWTQIISYIQENPKTTNLKESNKQLRLVIAPVKDIDTALNIASAMYSKAGVHV